ncbi:MAG: MarR family transcriptional regulator [Prolixibacteraceae bacterium]|jgi:DNA-binding MarR family transcriptional regulator|nr:MarR family transcriptional regulator [Prolixibacteraceae bacterium]
MELNKPLGYMLGMTLRVFKTRMMTECKKKDIELSLEQFVILNMLNANCDLIQQDLANHLQKDKSIIVRQIDGLIEDQYVVRLTNKEDKRKKNLILTKKGFERLNEMERIASEVSKKLLTGVSDSELEIFKDVLVKIQENGELEEEAI